MASEIEYDAQVSELKGTIEAQQAEILTLRKELHQLQLVTQRQAKTLSIVLKECPWCGKEMNDEERESPRFDSDGKPMCDDCYHQEYEWTCAKCEEYEHEDYRGGINCLFVVIDDEEAGVPVGTYRVKEHPYYDSDLFSSSFLQWAIEQVDGNTHGLTEEKTDYYPVGHLCRECARKLYPTATWLPSAEVADGN